MKKKIIAMSMLACLAGSAMADDTVGGGVYGSSAGTEWTMYVSLANAEAYCAFQTDIKLPAGVSVSAVTPVTTRLAQGSDATINGETVKAPFVVDYNTIDETNNIVRVIAYNLNNNAIAGTSGNLLKISLASQDSKEIADLGATVSNTIFVKNSDLTAVDLADFDAKGLLYGDVTQDGYVNTGDVNIVLSAMKGTATDYNPDVNGDGYTNTGDVNFVLDKMKGK